MDALKLDRKTLREFGLVTGGIVAVLFGGVFPWVLGRPIPIWPWPIAGALVLFALVAPMSLAIVYRGWMRFGHLASKITTPIIMGAVFFLAILPVSFVMRLLRRDPMARQFLASTSTYRVASDQRPPQDLERPF